MTVPLHPIGFVRWIDPPPPEERDPPTRAHFPERMAIDLAPSFATALEGLDGFSHLYVLFHFDRVAPAERILRARPCRRADMPELGVFATCAPGRPNPIGLTLVRLLAVEGASLLVEGLDALDRTPVLDLKPFFDAPAHNVVPEWVVRLREGTA